MPECSPVILSVRSLSRDTQIEKNRVVEDTKIWSKNNDLLQRIFKSQETSILEVTLETSKSFKCQKIALFPPISVAKPNSNWDHQKKNLADFDWPSNPGFSARHFNLWI